MVILTDGHAFHARDPIRIAEDIDRRNALTLSGYRLLEFTYQDVIEQPESVAAMIRGALMPTAQGRSIETWEPSDAIPSGARAFVERLRRRAPRLSTGGRIRLTSETTTGVVPAVDTLAVDPEHGLALIMVDVDRWPGDPDAWRRDLAAHNQIRLQRWRLIRVPSVWLGTPQESELIEQVLRS